jgi:hypothetical protein
VKIGTNFLRKDILDLENAGFHLPQRAIIFLRRLFGMEELAFDLSLYPTPMSPDDHPKTRLGKNIRRKNNMPTIKYANNCESVLTLKDHLR